MHILFALHCIYIYGPVRVKCIRKWNLYKQKTAEKCVHRHELFSLALSLFKLSVSSNQFEYWDLHWQPHSQSYGRFLWAYFLNCHTNWKQLSSGIQNFQASQVGRESGGYVCILSREDPRIVRVIEYYIQKLNWHKNIISVIKCIIIWIRLL